MLQPRHVAKVPTKFPVCDGVSSLIAPTPMSLHNEHSWLLQESALRCSSCWDDTSGRGAQIHAVRVRARDSAVHIDREPDERIQITLNLVFETSD